jgi:hypothetical protein
VIRRGLFRQVGLRSSRYGSVECGGVWFGNAGQYRRGLMGYGAMRCDLVRKCRLGLARLGVVRFVLV